MKITLLIILCLPILIINNEKPIEGLKINTLLTNSLQFNKSDSTYFVSKNEAGNIVYDFKPKNKNSQKPNFEIDFITDKLSLENPFLNFSKKQFFKVDDGWLVGCNAGEFGGGLFWFNETGTKYEQINHSNIISIFHFNNEIYYTSGMAHLSLNYGTLSKIERQSDKWKVVESVDLKARPYAHTFNLNQELLIITSSRILKIDKKCKIRTVLKSTFWSYLYPNSILLKNDEIYIGMRGGILQLDYNKPKNQVWLTE